MGAVKKVPIVKKQEKYMRKLMNLYSIKDKLYYVADEFEKIDNYYNEKENSNHISKKNKDFDPMIEKAYNRYLKIERKKNYNK